MLLDMLPNSLEHFLLNIRPKNRIILFRALSKMNIRQMQNPDLTRQQFLLAVLSFTMSSQKTYHTPTKFSTRILKR
jgi:hypothetical protein